MKEKLATPYYLIDEGRLLKNLKIIKHIRESAGAKSLLALKCFAAWSVFGLMKEYMDGTTSSSPYEARLGFEKFGKEVHSYSVGFTKTDIKEIAGFSDKIIFNSLSQLKIFSPLILKAKIGIRVNPGISYSHYDLANPGRRYSRLGVLDKKALRKALPLISGAMFHYNCENNDFKNFVKNLDFISDKYADILTRLEWVSLGGGFYFTQDGYPVDKFCEKLKEFSRKFNLQVYLEPGESAITNAGELVTRVVDIVHNQMDIAIVDASTEAHMLDLLIYRIPAKIKNESGTYKYIVAGRSCLAGDVFGMYSFKSRLKIGSIIRFADTAGYTMVKKNWFNGLKMPAIVVKRLDGSVNVVRRFGYKDFVSSLS